ncbi:uncharacterized protein LOC100210423 isoform X1 [Hydra vulgaris]|uniref:uncharacterized protein LOC100210423 isoform X1 n=1 Tax=Hydra vulgaris TaxID=6087 RepID=UPI0001924C72|nr:uncharacterized RNA-binding protein C660.15 [Hydra vulgaris]
MSELNHAAIQKLKVAELKVELTKRGLDTKGKKDELIQRLMENIEKENHIPQEQEAIKEDVENNEDENITNEKNCEDNFSEENLNIEEDIENKSKDHLSHENKDTPENLTNTDKDITANDEIITDNVNLANLTESNSKTNENTTETLHEMGNENLEEVSENVEEVSKSVEEVSKSVEEVSKSVEEETKGFKEESKIVEEESKSVEEEILEDTVDSNENCDDNTVKDVTLVDQVASDNFSRSSDPLISENQEEPMEVSLDKEVEEKTPEASNQKLDNIEKPMELSTKNEPKDDKCDEQDSEDEEIDYICPPEFDEREEMRKMFCGGLDKATTDEQFKELFSKFGEITDFIIIRKENSKSDRLFGFVTFAKCDDLEQCLLSRPHKFLEKELDVKRAVPRGQDDSTGHFKVKKLHVANIPEDFKAKDLKTYLRSRHPSKFGKIEEINFLKTKDEDGNLTDKNRGFGFITVSNEDYADRIAIAESKFTLSGHSMRISKAKPRVNDAGALRGAYRKSGYSQGWDDWGSYGAYGYNQGYGGYGYGQGYGAYDYYGGGYGGYGYSPQRTSRGGNRFNPY